MSRRSDVHVAVNGDRVRVHKDTGAEELAWGRPRAARCGAPYMLRAKAYAESLDTIEEVAHHCGVQPATAFSYVTALASEDEEFAALACRKFVCKCVRDAVRGVDTRGALRDVMARVSDCVGSEPEWREQEHVYAQVRLARLACT